MIEIYILSTPSVNGCVYVSKSDSMHALNDNLLQNKECTTVEVASRFVTTLSLLFSRIDIGHSSVHWLRHWFIYFTEPKKHIALYEVLLG